MAVPIYEGREKLIDYDLDVKLFESFNIRVSDLIPCRMGYILTTDKGRMLLKKAEYDIDRLEFILKSRQYMGRSFNSFVEIQETSDGKYYKRWGKKYYIVLKIGDMMQFDPSNIEHIKMAAESISSMHKASDGILDYMSANYYKLLKNSSSLTLALEEEEESLKKLESYKKWASFYIYRSPMDKMFLDNVDKFMDDIKESKAVLRSYSYDAACREKKRIGLCHNRLLSSNMLIDKNRCRFMNFDNSTIDLKIRDLESFINENAEYLNLNKINMIFTIYSRINGFDDEDINMLNGFLRFPKEFYDFARGYYEKRILLSEEGFEDRMNKVISFRKSRDNVMNIIKNYKIKNS